MASTNATTESVKELSDSLLAVYGSLRRAFLARRGFWIAHRLRFHGFGTLRGRLFWQDGYPGLVDWAGVVPVELFVVTDPALWPVLDSYEGYLLGNRRHSLFFRKQILLRQPSLCAYVYYLGDRIPRGRPVIQTKKRGTGRDRAQLLGWLPTN
jgi:gamma-glutamylcyclotransferase (GGCT)/AIG2-like uncharacterized protein YtfP